jgi:hypothetical protein
MTMQEEWRLIACGVIPVDPRARGLLRYFGQRAEKENPEWAVGVRTVAILKSETVRCYFGAEYLMKFADKPMKEFEEDSLAAVTGLSLAAVQGAIRELAQSKVYRQGGLN